MYPILFSIGKLNIYTHGLLIALGSFLGGLLYYYLAKREGKDIKHLFDLCLYSLIIGLIGARLIYIIINYYQFNNWYNMFYLSSGGFVSFGGIVFGFLTATLYLRAKRQNILQYLDLAVFGFLFGWAIGKVGCLLNGDTPGIQSQSKIAIAGQLPLALFESVYSMLIALVLTYLFIYKRDIINKYHEGTTLLFGFSLYFIGRFIIDFGRNEKILFFHLNLNQITSLIFLIGTLIYLFLINKKNLKGEENVKKNI